MYFCDKDNVTLTLIYFVRHSEKVIIVSVNSYTFISYNIAIHLYHIYTVSQSVTKTFHEFSKTFPQM